MKKITALFLASSFVALGLLASCDSATGTTPAAAAVSTPVYDVAFTYSKSLDLAVHGTDKNATQRPAVTFQVKPAYGLAITQAKVTYAVNAAAVSGGLDGSSWIFNALDSSSNWLKAWATGTNDSIVAGKWVTALLQASDISTAYSTTSSNSAGTSTSVSSVGGDVELSLWSTWANWADIAAGHVYVKKIELTYSDSTTETITFDQSGWATTADTNIWRLGQFSANSSGSTDAGITALNGSVTTVSF